MRSHAYGYLNSLSAKEDFNILASLPGYIYSCDDGPVEEQEPDRDNFDLVLTDRSVTKDRK